MILFLLGLTAALPFLACAASFLLTRRTEPGPLRLARAFGWCTLCCLPAILVQDVILGGGLSSTSGFGWNGYLTAWPFQSWVLAGGGLVQAVFESSAEEISGHRQSTMMDNWHIYYAFTVLWLLPWSAWIATRLRRGSLGSDRVAWLVFAVLLVNALAGTAWPWWAT